MANYDQAAQVLHRVGNSIDIKVNSSTKQIQNIYISFLKKKYLTASSRKKNDVNLKHQWN